MGLAEQILALGRELHSVEVAHKIKKTMTGVTWHCHYHLMYDLRTILGPDPKVYLKIGVYDGGSLAFMMQHPYETELHGVDSLVLPGQVEHTFANIALFNTFGPERLRFTSSTRTTPRFGESSMGSASTSSS